MKEVLATSLMYAMTTMAIALVVSQAQASTAVSGASGAQTPSVACRVAAEANPAPSILGPGARISARPLCQA